MKQQIFASIPGPALALLAVCFATLFGVLPSHAYHPNHALGFSPERTYQGLDQLDRVDLFSGSLALSLPIGPFSMTYSSNVWRYRPVLENGQLETEAIPDRAHFGGLGWHFGWGAVYSDVHALNDTGRWLYIAPDGSRHQFYDQLHRGEDDGDPNVLYTRDGSYLRLQRHNAFFVDVEFPDGTTRRYNSWTGGMGARYWLEKVWSRFGSATNPDAQATYNSDFSEWTLTERHGRVHKIYSSTQYSWLRVITRVEVGTVGGSSVAYDLEHTPTLIDVSCKDTASVSPARISVPLLTAIQMPDGTRFEMPSYHTTCAGGLADVSGTLRELVTPTGGRLRWTYQEYEFPPGDTSSVFLTSAGVATRQSIRRDGTIEGTWTYRTTDIGPGSSGLPHDDPKLMTEVVYPNGDCSRHFFNARYWQNPAQGRGWEYGLPFDYSQSLDGRYLSSEVWTSNTAGACAGAKLRSTYLRYRHDATPGSGDAPAAEWYHTNRQVSASRTVYHDDGDRWVDNMLSENDGLGHFRLSETTGNLWSGSSTQESRRTRTNYTAAQGTYGSPGYAPPGPSDPWILGVFSSIRTDEPDAFGQSAKQVDMKIDPSTGALVCTRVRKSVSALRSHDIVTTFNLDHEGLVTDVKTYGGDLQTLPTTGDGCTGLPTQPEYWLRHGYTHGVRTSTRPIQPDGTPGPFLTLDREVDPTTGTVLVERDPSGFAVRYTYDTLGRNHQILPDEGVRTTFHFTSPGARSGGKLRTERRDPASSALLTESEVEYDDFGRVWRERSRMPSGQWNERETLYSPRGWVRSISEWGNLAKTTQFLGHDPFGRATTIRPPDGSTHDVRLIFQGARRVSEQAKVARPGGEAYATRIRELDSHGRLRRVEEASGTGGAMVATTYSYDVASRLTRLRSGTNPVQERRYVYDNRGFLLSETHPEKGVQGNGTVVYGNRDSRGLLRRLTDGPNDLAFGYDFLGRRTRVWDRNQGMRVVLAFEHDGAPGRGLGKLWKATRNQWVDVPWIAGSSHELAKVTETFDRHGLGGAISRKEIRVEVGGEKLVFSQRYTWNALGQPSRIQAAGQDTSYAYSQGLLTEVPGWASLSYHSSGPWQEIAHTNGVRDLQTLDPDFTGRTGGLSATGPKIGTVGTGVMQYDGAGNVSAIGVWPFAYDAVSRLTSSGFLGWQQSFTWDAFGNQTTKTTAAPGSTAQTLTFPIDPATNRLSGPGYAYDGAGNLTAWGGNVYTWNESGLLEHTQAGGLDWIYLYTASGERVATLMPSAQPVVRWTERDLRNRLLTEYVQVGAVGAPGTAFSVKSYLWAGDRLLASDGPDGVRHYHPDHLGSIRMATDTTGESVFGMSYLPFGEPADPIDSSEILQLTGHERDHPTGLDYMHARFYTQVHGRFLSVDPLRGVSSAPQSLNRYAYALGSPLTLIDPDGQKAKAKDPKIPIPRASTISDITKPDQYPDAQQRYFAHLGTGFSQVGVSGLHLARGFGSRNPRSIHSNFRKGIEDTFLGLAHLNEADYQGRLHLYNTGRRAYAPVRNLTPGLDLTGLFTSPPPEQPPELEAGGVIHGGYGETVDVVGDKLPLRPLTSPGVTVPDELRALASPATTSVFSGSDTVCNQQSCFEFTVTGSDLGEVIREAQQISEEILAVGGLNELINGACAVNPYACAAGGFGGGGGGNYWAIIYAF